MGDEEEEDVTICDDTKVTLVTDDEDSKLKEASDGEEPPLAESTVISNGDTTLTEEQNESTEADRNHMTKKKIKIIKQTTKLNKKMKNSCCSFVTDVAKVDVRGK